MTTSITHVMGFREEQFARHVECRISAVGPFGSRVLFDCC
jgi:hypothetical protein